MLVGRNARDSPIVRGVCDLLEKVHDIRTCISVWNYRKKENKFCKERRTEPRRAGERKGEWARLGEG